jgi:hypothetical protein
MHPLEKYAAKQKLSFILKEAVPAGLLAQLSATARRRGELGLLTTIGDAALRRLPPDQASRVLQHYAGRNASRLKRISKDLGTTGGFGGAARGSPMRRDILRGKRDRPSPDKWQSTRFGELSADDVARGKALKAERDSGVIDAGVDAPRRSAHRLGTRWESEYKRGRTQRIGRGFEEMTPQKKRTADRNRLRMGR